MSRYREEKRAEQRGRELREQLDEAGLPEKMEGQGRWRQLTGAEYSDCWPFVYWCPECGMRVKDFWSECPGCGADMRGEAQA